MRTYQDVENKKKYNLDLMAMGVDLHLVLKMFINPAGHQIIQGGREYSREGTAGGQLIVLYNRVHLFSKYQQSQNAFYVSDLGGTGLEKRSLNSAFRQKVEQLRGRGWMWQYR